MRHDPYKRHRFGVAFIIDMFGTGAGLIGVVFYVVVVAMIFGGLAYALVKMPGVGITLIVIVGVPLTISIVNERRKSRVAPPVQSSGRSDTPQWKETWEARQKDAGQQ